MLPTPDETPPDPLRGVRTIDRPALARRLAELDAGAIARDDPRRADLAGRVAASAAETRARNARLPRPRFDQRLPILERRVEISTLIERHQVVVVCGETGSGKTTQLAQICLAIGRGAAGMIAHTQPRRIAARAVAARIADELAVPLGGAVGVKVRFNDRTSDTTALKLMTDGMLLAETAGDPDLAAYDTIIIDEAHERSLNIDFLLGYIRQLLPRRPDLKLIITSATIDPARFSEHFGGPGRAPVIEVSGRTFPVELRHRPSDPRDFESDSPSGVDSAGVADALLDLMRPGETGDALVFLPGEREIRECEAALRRERLDAEVLPLYARLSSQEQDRVFTPGARRRVLLATNVAETSLTVPNIRFVVDAGQARINRYDPRAGVQRLPVEWISRASAAQRAGRCGRVAAGICLRLYSERLLSQQPPFTPPEILRSGLAGVILQMKALNLGPIDKFPFLDAPDAGAIRTGCETLFELGALDTPTPDARITPLGRRLARLPLDPHVGRVLLAGEDEGCLREIVVLAAALSIQDPRERPPDRREAADAAQRVFTSPSSDFLTLLTIWEHFREAQERFAGADLRSWCRANFLNHARVREWGETIAQLKDACDDLDLTPNRLPAASDAIHRALLTGLLANLCCKEDASTHEYRGPRGRGVSIFPGSALFKKPPRWLIAAEIVETSRLYARTCAPIEPEWIESLASHVLTRSVGDEHFDPESGRACAWERVTLRGLVVVPRRRVPLAELDPARARDLFIRRFLCSANDALAETQPPRALDALLAHNAQVFGGARALEAKLRRHAVIISEDALARWFDPRLPPAVVDRSSLDAWLQVQPEPVRSTLKLDLSALISSDARVDDLAARFPDAITIATASGSLECPLSYAFEPGKDSDGLTLTLPLRALAEISDHRPDWLVPGLLAPKLLALLKQLPKAHRARVEAGAPDLAHAAEDLSQLMSFADGPLPVSLSQTLDALLSPPPGIPPEAWPLPGVPEHLRMRFRVLGPDGRELGTGRSLSELRARFAARIREAQAAAARARFDRRGITTWDFGELPTPRVEPQDAAPSNAEPRFPALLDARDSVSFTLMHSAARAEAHTDRGLRRLFALAVKDESDHLIAALPALDEMSRWYQGLGTREDVQDAVLCLAAERLFLFNQVGVTTRDQFEQRLAAQRGRLAQILFETAETVHRTLEMRSKVAHRLASGTPRLWAASIADIREHAAYLMPAAFLSLISWENFRNYPRYTSAMRERLFRLREDGSGAETGALATFTPHWKKFTGWVARAMSADPDTLSEKHTPGKGKSRAALPSNRRTVAVVNVDAGSWALQPGALPEVVASYRWMLEEARIRVFGENDGKTATSNAELAELTRAGSPLAIP